MNVHSNARTTVRSRALLVRKVRVERATPASVASGAGISLRTLRKWLARYRDEGFEGLLDRSSRPRRSPARTPDERVEEIRALRLARLTATAIARTLDMALSTVARILRRLGLARARDLDPPEPARRYEWARPGDLVHLDVKKLGKIGAVGHRIHGDPSRRCRGVGWEFVHVAQGCPLDDHTRLAYVEILPDERAPTAAAFRELGVGVRRVLTDNGGCYRAHRFEDACRRWGLRHRFTRPYTPRTNGKAERFIQTVLREWAYAAPYESSAERAERLDPWLHHYNYRRPHASLGKRPPLSRIPNAWGTTS